MIDPRITFEERVNHHFHINDEQYNFTTLYFTAPKELLNGKFPEAESMEISIEFPVETPSAIHSEVLFSPTKDGSDYDWYPYDISDEDVDELIGLAIPTKEESKMDVTSSNFKEVRFDIYCSKCKHHTLDEVDDPCNTCLETGVNEGTEKPICYEEDDGRNKTV